MGGVTRSRELYMMMNETFTRQTLSLQALTSCIQHTDVEAFRATYVDANTLTSHTHCHGVIEYNCILYCITNKREEFIPILHELCNLVVTKQTLQSLAYRQALMILAVEHDSVQGLEYLVDLFGLQVDTIVLHRVLLSARFRLLVVLLEKYGVKDSSAGILFIKERLEDLGRRINNKPTQEELCNCVYYLMNDYPHLCLQQCFLQLILRLQNSMLVQRLYDYLLPFWVSSGISDARQATLVLIQHITQSKSLKYLRMLCKAVPVNYILPYMYIVMEANWVNGFHYLYSLFWLHHEELRTRLFIQCWNPRGSFEMQECCIALHISLLFVQNDHGMHLYAYEMAQKLNDHLTYDVANSSFFYPQYKQFFLSPLSKAVCLHYPMLSHTRSQVRLKMRTSKRCLSNSNLLPACLIDLVLQMI